MITETACRAAFQALSMIKNCIKKNAILFKRI